MVETRAVETRARRGADVEVLRETAMALRAQGRIEAWLEAAAAWAAAAPGDARPFYHQGYAARQLGRAEPARAALTRAVELAPGFASARMELGVLLQEAGDAAAAAEQFAAIARLEPGNAQARINQGAALRKAGRHAEAEAAYAAALALAPDHFELRQNLANLLIDLERPEEALLHLRRAVELRPGDAEAHLRQGAALQKLQRTAEAYASYRHMLTLEPGSPRALLALGILMHEGRRLGLAERFFRRATAGDASNVEGWLMLASVLHAQGRAAEAEAAHAEAVARGVGSPGLRSNDLMYLNNRDDLPAAEITRRHREWGLQHSGTIEREAPYPNPPEPGRRLRIGYLSPDFRAHSVSYFLMPLIEAHDHAAVEIHAYADVAKPDDKTERYRALADHWRDVHGLDDAALARLIEADGIDILVELAGHTAGSRLLACALRPAPVQATWLGYPNTTGLPAVDWRMVDAITDPPGAEALAVERLCRLQHGFLCYTPSPKAPEVAPPPSLARGSVTFGSFNNAAKLSPATLACWAELLRALPDARLLLSTRTLSDPIARRRLHRRFRELGVPSERIELRPGIPDVTGHLASYSEVDIALDPFPYNGTTTSCESLWMGLPLITLLGDRHSARVGASILHQLDLGELVAGTAEAYVAKAVELAGDPARLADLRAGMRQRMRASPLMDGPGFARDVETAYRQMWRDWCERQRPPAAPPSPPRRQAPPRRQVPPSPPLPAAVAARLEQAIRQRRWSEACDVAQRVLKGRPEEAAGWRALTVAQRGLGRLEESLAAALRWRAAAPEDARAAYQQGLTLARMRRTVEARDAHAVAVALSPRFASAVMELGVACSRLDENEAAAGHFRRVLAIEPDHAQAHANLGAVLRRLGRPGEARQAYEAGLARAADSRPLHLNLGNLLSQELGLPDEALPHQRRAIELAVAAGAAEPVLESDYLLTLNYVPGPPAAEIAAEHAAWGQRLASRVAAANPAPRRVDAAEGRRLRIGYISPDLCSHSVSHFIGPVLAHHDRAAVEVSVYADVDEPDNVTRQLRRFAERWHDVHGRSDAEVAALIAADGIDILVELAGHTKGNRLPLLAQRPAPVQASWLGYPNTTGLAAIDWRIVDVVTDPPGAESLAVERLCRLPRGFLSYGTPAEAPETAPPPSIGCGHVTFGSFNNGLKLSEPTVRLWGRLLAAVPGSRLLLKGRGLGPGPAEERIRGWLAEAGIAPDRVRMLERITDRAGHLGLYGEVDIALDPFPYGGTTTSCEALWMGVPVISLLGDRHAARVGASILHRIGLDELVAGSEADYLAKAVALAADPGRLLALRSGMRQRMLASPLCNGTGLARDLEAAYGEMWRRHCDGDGEAGAGIALPPAAAPGLRLHIGGKEPRRGWTILNIQPGPDVDLVGSCTDLGAVADGSCELVYASHVLEHLGYRDELPRALGEIRRVLRPGGRLHVSVPDLAVLAELLLRPDLDEDERYEVMRMIHGGQVDAHDLHKTGFTWGILERMLRDAGFGAISPLDDHGFFNDTSRYAAHGRKISLNVVATRP